MNYKEDILTKTLLYFSHYPFLTENDVTFLIKNSSLIIHYYNMVIKEYIIFLPNIYYSISKNTSSCFPFFLKNIVYLKDSLEKEDVAVIPYEKVHLFKYIVHLFNQFHKKYPLSKLYENLFMDISKILHNVFKTPIQYKLFQYKEKEYYFYENDYLPNILYKKIIFSKMIQCISIEYFAYKKNEYLLRSFCQIAEELGATKIQISNNYILNEEQNKKLGLFSSTTLLKNSKKNLENNYSYEFIYSDNNYINLNEFMLYDKIMNENKFWLSKEDFESNIELKHLISSRCKNLIEQYYTQFRVHSLNSKELNIYFILKDFQIDIFHQYILSETIETSIKIDFLNILNHHHLIDGGNIYPLKEGYIYLKNILNQKHNSSLYIHFLKAHLYGIQNKHIYLAYDYQYIHNVMKIYHQCIELNFSELEFIDYIQKYWNSQSEWYHFIQLRDIILKGNDNDLNKLHFVSFQYMNIFQNKYNLIQFMEKYLLHKIDSFILSHINTNLQSFIDNKYTLDNLIDYDSDDEKNILKTQFYESEFMKKNENTKIPLNNIQNVLKNKNTSKYSLYTLQKSWISYLSNYTLFEDNDSLNPIDLNNDIIRSYLEYVDFINNKKNNSFIQNSNKFDIHSFKNILQKEKFSEKIIKLILKGVKGSFYYENGISNNLENIQDLQKVIFDVILYYFRDEIKNLQSLCTIQIGFLQKFKIIDIQDFILEMIQSLLKYYLLQNSFHSNTFIIQQNKSPTTMFDSFQLFNKDDSSPVSLIKKNNNIISDFDTKKNTYIDESTKIFIKFISKEVTIPNEDKEKELYQEFVKKVRLFFPLQMLLLNYRKHRIFYTYQNYLDFTTFLKNDF